MYFDLSVRYLDSQSTLKLNKTQTQTRLQTLTRLLTLGYTAIAYDRLIPPNSVISDHDRCQIQPFNLPSILHVAPSLASAVNFHRELNGVSKGETFRQYRRVTVCIDRGGLGKVKSSEGVLRTYDLVAVKALDQVAFDGACKELNVDIIALDFPLNFRLKQPMVKAAIKRGVYFEIKYAGLIADVNTRKLMLSDVRLLVDCTRGKNLIISSSATSLNDIRGPHDIVNLSSFLLGLSKERAKEAISKNCRSLIANTLRKKDHKQAIKIERISSDKLTVSQSDLFIDWKEWDPISSGDGDLPPLDDISKFFSDINKLPKNTTAINFDSCAKEFSLKDHISSSPRNQLAMSEKAVIPCSKECKLDTIASTNTVSSNYEILGSFIQNTAHSVTVGATLTDTPLINCTSRENDITLLPDIDTCASTVDEIRTLCTVDIVDSNMPDAVFTSIEAPIEKVNMEEQIEVTAVEKQIAEVMSHDNLSEMKESACMLFDDIPFENRVSESKEEVKVEVIVEKDDCMEEVLVENERHTHQESTAIDDCTLNKLKSGNGRLKGRSRPVHPLPFKGLLKPMLFKKKSCQSSKPSRHCKDRL